MPASLAAPSAHCSLGELWTPAADLAQRYPAIRGATQALAAPLSAEDQNLQSMPDASPTKWHLAHTTWFFETFVLATQPGFVPFHPRYGYLFNSYYETVGSMHPRPQRGLLSRPTVDEVMNYRAHVDEQMQRLLGRGDLDADTQAIVEIGLHHEQQHQELVLTDIKHGLYQNPLRPQYRATPVASTTSDAIPLEWLDVPEGLVQVGHEGEGFGFDNEFPRHRVFVRPFRLASRLVTAGEFAEFIADGGYDRPDLWLSAGWSIVQQRGWSAPLYWERQRDDPRDHQAPWQQFTLGGMRPVVDAEPVTHLSLYEADAFARWHGSRLPTEFEWETAVGTLPVQGNFVDTGRLHPAPATEEPGLRQAFGDTWEWTASAYAPYPGFRPLAGSLAEYNGKFMCNQLVLRGGSCATPASHARATYRNFFPPETRWQFSGLRLAKDR